jgi:hypothetical protein
MWSRKSAPPERGAFFGMNWMLLLVFGTIAVGTLMGTTAPPVL